MALWVEEQLLAMRDFEVKFYVSRAERQGPNVERLNTENIRHYIAAAKLLFGVTLNADHIVKNERPEDDKMYRWTYSWLPTTGDAYAPEYEFEFTLKSMTNSLPKALVKLRVRDRLARKIDEDEHRDRYFSMSSWDDTNNRWLYREVADQ